MLESSFLQRIPSFAFKENKKIKITSNSSSQHTNVGLAKAAGSYSDPLLTRETGTEMHKESIGLLRCGINKLSTRVLEEKCR